MELSNSGLRPGQPSMTQHVHHPDHYQLNGLECIDVVEHFDFVVGNIIKYAWRAGLKPGNSRLQDLEKCLWYAQRAVDREKALGDPDPDEAFP